MTDEQTPDQQPVKDTGDTSKAVTQQPLEANHQNDPDDGYSNRPVALITDPAPLPPDTNLAQVIGTPGPLGLGGANDPDQGGINAHLSDGNAPGLAGAKPLANQGGDSFIEAAAGLPTYDKTHPEYFRGDVLSESADTTPGPNAEQVFPTGTYGPIGEQVQPTGQPVDEIDASDEHATSANLVDAEVTQAAVDGPDAEFHTNQQEQAAPQSDGAVPSTLDTGSAAPNAVDETIYPPADGDTFEPYSSTSEPDAGYEPTFTDKSTDADGTVVLPAEVELEPSTGPDEAATDERGGAIDTSFEGGSDLVGVQPAAPLPTDPTPGPQPTDVPAPEDDPHAGGDTVDEEAVTIQDAPPASDSSEPSSDTSAAPSEDAGTSDPQPSDTSASEPAPVEQAPVEEQAPATDEPTAGEPDETPADEPTVEELPADTTGEGETLPAADESGTSTEEQEGGPYTRTTQNPDLDRDHTVMPARNDRKEDWYDYAQTRGYTGEYEDHTKQWFIANYGGAEQA